MTTAATKIASKYMLGPKIGSGSFGQVYAVSLIGSPEIYALKRQDQKSKNSQLVVEYKILKLMNNVPGFARVHWHGTQNKWNQLIMDMLGPSLEDLFQVCGKIFSLKTTIMIVDQMIRRIEELHGQNYIHRDIKPQNFLMGIGKNSHIVHVIDFGLSKKYRDSKTHQHIPYKQNKNLTGTARYASINAHLGIQQSRRDDLEAIGHVMLYFLQGFLPWQGIKANNKNQKYQKIMEKKMSIPIEIQCKGLPVEISTFLTYCRSLKFTDKPDYSFLRRILRELLDREGHRFDFCYDWTNLKQDRNIDNGKIKLQIRSTHVDNDNIEGMQKSLVKSGFSKSQPQSPNPNMSMSMKSSRAAAASKKPSPTKMQFSHGEQNINEDDIGEEQSEECGKNVGLWMDLEEKRQHFVVDSEEEGQLE